MFNNFMDNFQDMFSGMGGGDSLWLEPDFLLTNLVSGMVNVGGVELGITLFVKGSVITGTLVGEREYLEKVSEIFKSQIARSLAALPEEQRKLAEAALDFTQLAEDVYPDMDEDNPDEDQDFDEDYDEDMDAPANPILHLHLKDPLLIHPQPAVSFMNNLLPIMRIRLTSIDGWMLGKADMLSSDFPEDNSGIRH